MDQDMDTAVQINYLRVSIKNFITGFKCKISKYVGDSLYSYTVFFFKGYESNSFNTRLLRNMGLKIAHG